MKTVKKEPGQVWRTHEDEVDKIRVQISRDDRKESTAMTHKYDGTNENAYGSVTLNEI